MYRVSHIKLDRVNGSKLRFWGQSRNFKKNEKLVMYKIDRGGVQKSFSRNIPTKSFTRTDPFCVQTKELIYFLFVIPRDNSHLKYQEYLSSHLKGATLNIETKCYSD